MRLVLYNQELAEVVDAIRGTNDKVYCKCYTMDGHYLGWIPADVLNYVADVPKKYDIDPDWDCCDEFTELDEKYLHAYGVKL
jgi:hypothetical protein